MSSKSKRTRGGRRLGFEALEDRRLLAIDFNLVKDINPLNTTSSNPEHLVEMNGEVYFAAKSRETGIELWKSDGTAAGTTLVKDIRAGTADSSPKALNVFDGALYFIASDGVHGEELWRSDGTAAGTQLVKDIRAGAASSEISVLQLIGGQMYFVADDGIHGGEIWVSDGTANGTRLLLDINPGDDHSLPGGLTEFDGRVFFTANATGTTEGRRIWTTDGTAEGTQQFSVAPSYYSGALVFTAMGDSLFFANDYGLVKTDGTVAGTELVKAFTRSPRGLIAFDDTLYFSGYETATGYELWTSDGTEAGTKLLKSIGAGSGDVNILRWSEYEGTIYFAVEESSAHYWWKTDGTPEGTVSVQYFGTALIGSAPMRVGDKTLLVVSGNLWETDATLTSRTLLKDVTGGDWLTGVRYPIVVNGILYFTTDTGEYGRELWRSDGTAEGTQLIVDLYADTSGSSPFDVHVLDGELYFVATIGQFLELWKSDGTAEGTFRVRDLALGNTNNDVLSLTRLGEVLLMTVKDDASGEQLWTSDGTEAGTTLVKVLRESGGGIAFGRPAFFAEAGGLLYFRGLKPDGNPSFLWRTDGTEAGTHTVNDLENGADLLYPRSMTEVGEFMMFRGDDGIHGFELWRSDGTNAGTYLVKDINLGPANSANTSSSDIPGTPPMTSIGGVLYFFADDGTSGFELWRSDGTEIGTYRVKDIRPGEEGSRTTIRGDALHTFAVGNTLYFSASDGEHGVELWRSDGTEDGTVMVADLYEGQSSSLFGSFTEVNGTFYFTANDGVSGPQIWKIAPGATEPERVTNINPNPIGTSVPAALTNVNGMLYFSADDGIHGRELWRTDGTLAGTEFVYDFTGDATSGSPSRMTNLNGRLVVSAATVQFGREWWIADFADTGDFNLDGDINDADYAVWRSKFGSTTELSADANRNGVVDAGDYTIWRNHLVAPAAEVAGDYDDDGVVGEGDRQVWRDTFGSTTQLQADGNGNGVVDAADHTVWRDHFVPSGGAAISVAAEVTEGIALQADVQDVVPLERALETTFGFDVSKELTFPSSFAKPHKRMPAIPKSMGGVSADSLLVMMVRSGERDVALNHTECKAGSAMRGAAKELLFESLGLWQCEPQLNFESGLRAVSQSPND